MRSYNQPLPDWRDRPLSGGWPLTCKNVRLCTWGMTRAFNYKDKNIFVKLYKQYVRPHLEFAVQAWSPWSVANIKVIEKVHKKMARMVSGLRGPPIGVGAHHVGGEVAPGRHGRGVQYKELKHGN